MNAAEELDLRQFIDRRASAGSRSAQMAALLRFRAALDSTVDALHNSPLKQGTGAYEVGWDDAIDAVLAIAPPALDLLEDPQ